MPSAQESAHTIGDMDGEMSSSSRTERPSSGSSSSTRTSYLVYYNFISALLWLSVLGRVVLLVPLVGHSHVYGGVGEFAKWTQTLAVLEMVHSAAGLVRSPLATTALQVSSRLVLVWAVVDRFPQLGESWAYSAMLLAWSLTEGVRYSYFVLSLRGAVPKPLTWLRCAFSSSTTWTERSHPPGTTPFLSSILSASAARSGSCTWPRDRPQRSARDTPSA